MIAGLETPTSGRITIGDRVVFDSEQGINIPANKRKVGFLFQNYALWPNMTVYENISFGLTNVKEEMDKIDFDVREKQTLIEILKKPIDVVKTIKECYDKKGKLDNKKVIVKLIDRYSISQYTAKKLFEMGLYKTDDYDSKAKTESDKLEKEIVSIKEKLAKTGYSLDENAVYLKDGQKVRGIRKYSKEEIDLIVRRVSRIVKIGMFMDRYPAE